MTTITLTLEQIGDRKPWVAAIVGRHPKYTLDRRFVDGVRDYSGSNRPGTRGIYTTWSLGDGLYEICDPVSWGRTDRYFARVVDGDLVRLTAADVMQALEEHVTG